MGLLSTLKQKPWLSSEYTEMEQIGSVSRYKSKHTALLFFLSIITVVFFLFTITLLQRSQSFDFQALSGKPWLPFSDLSKLWLNTLLLAIASVMFELSYCFYARCKRHFALLSTIAILICTALFILGQLQVWQQLNQSGFYLNSNPANSYFYLLTGIHGLHLLGGIAVLFMLLWRITSNQAFNAILNNLSLCKLYWHYLFALWLFLFFILTGSAERYKTIAVICGF